MAIWVVDFRLEAMFVFVSFPLAFLVVGEGLVGGVLALVGGLGGGAVVGLRGQAGLAALLHEVVVGRLDGGVPQHVLDEVRRVLLQQHFVPLLEYFKHVVVQILVQRHVLMMLILGIIDAHAAGIACPGAVVVAAVVQEFAAASPATCPDGTARLHPRLRRVLVVAAVTRLILTGVWVCLH